MDKLNFVTITGINHYYGIKPFKINTVVKLVKDYDNEYDDEAIAVVLPCIGKVGYVANSTYTVCAGTISAGRLYDKISDYTYAKIMFMAGNSIIAGAICKKDIEGFKKTKINLFGEKRKNFIIF